MTGKAYYITTLGDWQRHAARFANSHFIVLDAPIEKTVIPSALTKEGSEFTAADDEGSAVAFQALHGEMPQQIPRTETLRRPRNDNVGEPVKAQGFSPAKNELRESPTALPEAVAEAAAPERQYSGPIDGDSRILVLIEADEGVHLSLEDDPAFHPLPHPLAQKPISDAAQSALAPHGVAPGATTFDAAETFARIHPLLKHRVF